MSRRFLNLDQIDRTLADGFAAAAGDMALSHGRLLQTLDARCIRYAFSDASVGRDQHTIAADAWDTRNFETNPVFLWAHQDDELPVGKVENLATENGRLVGQVRYAEHDFADTVYNLVKGGYLNATSTGWLPLEWRAASDRKRPGGLDFTRVELLEISQVPVPALPTALVTARSAGLNVKPLYDWAERLLDAQDFAVIGRADLEKLRRAAKMPVSKRAADKWSCGAERDLPVDDKTAWDGDAAAGRMLDAATKNGEIDVAEAGRGFLLHDGSGERGGFKEPFADIVDGKLKAIAGGVRAAVTRLPDVKGVDEATRKKAQDVIDAYHKKIAKEVGSSTGSESDRKFGVLRQAQDRLRQRDLNGVADFAYYLASIEYLYDRVAAEAVREDDGSPVPAKLRAWIDDGNRLLLEMTGEEIQEQIDGTQDPGAYPMYWSAETLEAAVARALDKAGIKRKGAKHSAETLRCMRAIHKHVKAAHKQLSDMLDDADDANPEDADDDPEDEDARAARAARAEALKAKFSKQ